MPKVKKSNRIITVEKSRVDGYLSRGYDQVNEEGEIIKRATGGKTISLGEHNKALDEKAQLEKEVEELKGEIKKVKAENTKLKKDLEAK